MVKVRASCSVTGKKFSPATFSKISSVRLNDAHENGAIGSIGRYRGKPTPYGQATIEVSDKAEEDWSRFNDLIALLESCIDQLRASGAEEITVSCSLFHDGQCNFSFSQEDLHRIAALKVELMISCYDSQAE